MRDTMLVAVIGRAALHVFLLHKFYSFRDFDDGNAASVRTHDGKLTKRNNECLACGGLDHSRLLSGDARGSARDFTG